MTAPTVSGLLSSSPLTTVETSLVGFCTFLGALGAGVGFDFFSGTASSLAEETRRLDRRGSSAGIPPSGSFAFLLAMVLDRYERVLMFTMYESGTGTFGRYAQAGVGVSYRHVTRLATPFPPPAVFPSAAQLTQHLSL